MLNDNIEIIELENFYSKKLNNHRNIKIYLPPSYNRDLDKYYPVLYTHDGQNVFAGEKSYSGESWDLHKTSDYLIRSGLIEEIIIVAIDNMKEERLSEYAYEDGNYKGKKVKAKAHFYEKFITKELMPVIEEEFRVKKGAGNTALMGSSMGGLVTFNIGLKRADLFGKLAVMSPSFWWGKSSPLQKLKQYDYSSVKTKIWLDTGDSEGKFITFSDKVIDKILEIKKQKAIELFYYLAPGGIHSEKAWAERVYCTLIHFYGRIGKKKKIKLFVKEQIKVSDKALKINPVMYFDSTFKMTVLEGKYKSSNPEILKVDQKGNLKAKKAGIAKIKFSAYGLKTAKTIKVIEKRPEKQ